MTMRCGTDTWNDTAAGGAHGLRPLSVVEEFPCGGAIESASPLAINFRLKGNSLTWSGECEGMLTLRRAPVP